MGKQGRRCAHPGPGRQVLGLTPGAGHLPPEPGWLSTQDVTETVFQFAPGRQLQMQGPFPLRWLPGVDRKLSGLLTRSRKAGTLVRRRGAAHSPWKTSRRCTGARERPARQARGRGGEGPPSERAATAPSSPARAQGPAGVHVPPEATWRLPSGGRMAYQLPWGTHQAQARLQLTASRRAGIRTVCRPAGEAHAALDRTPGRPAASSYRWGN